MKTAVLSNKLKLLFIAIIFCAGSELAAQNEVAIGSNTTKSNAILWLNGNGSQGLILPVVTNKTAVSNPDKGMIVYDDSDNKVWYRNSTTWVEVGGGGTSPSNLNLLLSGNSLQLRDGSTVLNSVNIAGGTSANGSFLVFQNGSWQFATLSGDITGANGALVVNSIKGKAVANLPASIQALAYDPTANSGAGGWTFQALTGAGTVTNVSGTAPVTVTNPTTTPTISLANAGITNALLANDAVTSSKILDGTITGADIANTTITANKLAQSAATTNQVLQWNGTSWVPATLATGGTVTQVNSGAGLTGGPITNSGTLSIAAGGVGAAELANNAVDANKLANDAVTSTKILDGTITSADIANISITANKLAQSGAAAGQVLKWNGTNWIPQNDDAGSGAVPTLSNGQILIGDGVNNSGVALSGDGTLSGGVLTISANAITSGKILDATITGADIANTTITGANIANTTITVNKLAQSGAINDQVLQWNGTNWVPVTLAAGGTVTQINSGTGLTGGPITSSGTLSIAAGGVSSTELANDAVTSAKILDATITGADIANTTITANKLAQSGATNNQVLQWNGTNWIPASAASGTVTSINTGTGLTGGPITSTGTVSIAAGGVGTTELANNAVDANKLANDAVTSAKILDGTITAADIANTAITANKLAQSGAAAGQVLKWNGTNWIPQNDDAGSGAVPTLSNGQILIGDGVNNSGVALSGDGTLSGGVLTISTNAITSAKILDATITGADIATSTITANKLAQSGATNNQVLQWNGTNWVPASAASGTVTSINTGTGLTGGPITSSGTVSIAAGGVSVTELANDAVTSAKILDATITGADIANTTITTDKLAQSGAANNQVLQWNGTNWVPVTLPGSTPDVTTQTGVLVGDGSTITGTTAGAGVRGILGSNDNTIGWVTGVPNQLLGTNAAGDLQFTDKSNFIPSILNSGQIIVGNASNNPNPVTMSGDATLSNAGALTIANNVVTSAKILDATITGSDIANTTITANKLAQSSASSGQVLKWNGSAWVAANDDSGISTTLNSSNILVGNASNVATAVAMSGDATLANTGALTIANNAITSAKILDGTIVNADIANATINSAKLAQSSATSGQVLKWNGTAWAAANDDSGISTTLNSANILVGNASNVATAVAMSGDATLANTGALTIANNAITSAKILDGTIANVDIANATINSAKLAQSGATTNQVLQWNGTNWTPSSLPATFSTLNSVPRGNGTTLVASSIFDNGTYTGINRTSAISGSDRFSIGTNAASGAWGGMYIDTQTGGKPFYGFSQNGVGGSAWIELNGADANKMQFINGGSIGMTMQTNGNVGIGTTTPNYRMHVNNSATDSYIQVTSSTTGTTVSDGLLVGSGTAGDAVLLNRENTSMQFHTNNTERVRISNTGVVGIGTSTFSSGAKLEITGGDLYITDNFPFISLNTNTNNNAGIAMRSNASARGWVYYASASNEIILSNTTAGGTKHLAIGTAGRVGMGRTATTNTLEVEGNASKTAAGGFLANSDRRIKRDIGEIDNSLELIKKLHPVKFRYSEEWIKRHPSLKSHYYYNFIAQEYQKVFPESVQGSGEYIDGDPEEIIQIDSYNAQIVSIKAIQEQQKLIELQQKEIENLRMELEALKEYIHAEARQTTSTKGKN